MPAYPVTKHIRGEFGMILHAIRPATIAKRLAILGGTLFQEHTTSRQIEAIVMPVKYLMLRANTLKYGIVEAICCQRILIEADLGCHSLYNQGSTGRGQ